MPGDAGHRVRRHPVRRPSSRAFGHHLVVRALREHDSPGAVRAEVHPGGMDESAQRGGHRCRVGEPAGLASDGNFEAGEARNVSRRRAGAVDHHVALEALAPCDFHAAHAVAGANDGGDPTSREHRRAALTGGGEEGGDQRDHLHVAFPGREHDVVHLGCDGEIWSRARGRPCGSRTRRDTPSRAGGRPSAGDGPPRPAPPPTANSPRL